MTTAVAPDLTDWASALRDPAVPLADVVAFGRRALGLTSSQAPVNAAHTAKPGHDGGGKTPEPAAAAACDLSPSG